MSAPASPRDAGALAAALAGRGLAMDVEAQGALAVLVPRHGARALDAATRGWMVAAARDAGFSHVALELRPAAGVPPRAAPPRPHGGPIPDEPHGDRASHATLPGHRPA